RRTVVYGRRNRSHDPARSRLRQEATLSLPAQETPPVLRGLVPARLRTQAVGGREIGKRHVSLGDVIQGTGGRPPADDPSDRSQCRATSTGPVNRARRAPLPPPHHLRCAPRTRLSG